MQKNGSLFMWHRLVPMDEAMNVAGAAMIGEHSARENPGTSLVPESGFFLACGCMLLCRPQAS